MTAIVKKAWISYLVLGVSCGLLSSVQAEDNQAPIKIKAVVVTMFEHGELVGDRPGEFQFWVERFPLDQQLPFDMGQHPLRLNDAGVDVVVTGDAATEMRNQGNRKSQWREDQKKRGADLTKELKKKEVYPTP